jgi:transposase
MALMTMVETRAVCGGVDTHLDAHVAAAVDGNGGLLGVESFPATGKGYVELFGWLVGFGDVIRVGVEGTGSYGAGLARMLRTAGVEVVEVDRPNRQARRRHGKSDPVDAVEAARAAQSGRACGAAKTRDGNVEAIRALVVAKRSARSTKIKSLNQIRHLAFTAPDELRERLKGCSREHLAAEAASLRPRPGGDAVLMATKTALRTLGRRVLALDEEKPPSTSCWPGWSRRPPRGCWACTVSASTPPPRCWSPPATTRSGSVPRPPGRICVESPRSRPLRAK